MTFGYGTDSTVSRGFGENVIPIPPVDNFPGRFSTCNLVFRGFGGQGVQVVKKNEMNRSIFDTSPSIFSNVTHMDTYLYTFERMAP